MLDQSINSELINCIISRIDDMISAQLHNILHHKRFQCLEASWRGLNYLVSQIEEKDKDHIKIKALNISWHELSKDLSRAVEFDQSSLFIKIYSEEFGKPGGEPFGILIGDYNITHNFNNRNNDLEILRHIAKVAAAAFAPFITSISPSLLGLDNFSQMDRLLNLDLTFKQDEYYWWKRLREDEDARFIGLALPHIIFRLPYNDKHSITNPFRYSEKINSQSDYLWGNPAYCFAAATARSFAQSGWFTSIRGVNKNDRDGKVANLPEPKFNTDQTIMARKTPLAVYITNKQEKILADNGFICLLNSEKLPEVAFYECPSLQKPKQYDKKNVSQNTRISSMIHYILCISRFAHYLKVIARDKIGTFATPEQCEKYLQEWLHLYTAASVDLSDELKAKYPLRDGKVHVYEKLGSPGHYLCTIHLVPHYQFDQVETSLQFKTELV